MRLAKYICLFVLSAFLVNTVIAQTYFYLENITVTPENPVEGDTICILISGNKADPCKELISSEFGIQQDSLININFDWYDPGLICIQVLEPWDTILKLYELPKGNYFVNYQGDFNGGNLPTEPIQFSISPGLFINNYQIDLAQTYPNPANDHLNIVWNAGHNALINRVRLFNNNGQLVFDQKYPSSGQNSNQTVIEIGDLLEGLYLGKIYLNNEDVKIFKFQKL